jgi:hypothetical protein
VQPKPRIDLNDFDLDEVDGDISSEPPLKKPKVTPMNPEEAK